MIANKKTEIITRNINEMRFLTYDMTKVLIKNRCISILDYVNSSTEEKEAIKDKLMLQYSFRSENKRKTETPLDKKEKEEELIKMREVMQLYTNIDRLLKNNDMLRFSNVKSDKDGKQPRHEFIINSFKDALFFAKQSEIINNIENKEKVLKLMSQKKDGKLNLQLYAINQNMLSANTR